MNRVTPAQSHWEILPPLPEPNGGFISGTLGGNILIAGGTNWKNGSKHWLDRVWLFEKSKNAWRDAGRLSRPLAYAAFGEFGGCLFYAGGSSGAQTSTTLSVINQKGTVKIIAVIEPQIVYSASAVLNGVLYAIGGAHDQMKPETASNHCFAIDLKSGEASRIADLPGAGFIIGAAAAAGGRLYVFGGAHWDAAAGSVVNSSAAFSWSPSEDQWLPLKPLPSTNRGLTALTLDERHILVAGGYKNDVETFTSEAFVYDTKQGKFLPVTFLPYNGLVALTKCAGHVYCLGGEDDKKHRTDAAYRIPISDLLKFD